MASTLRLEPDLAAVVDRARTLTEDAGEVTPGQGMSFESRVPPEVGVAIIELLRDGTYAAAVARVVADDPDLADE